MIRRAATWMGETAVAMLLALTVIAISMPVTQVQAAIH
jgi:hypothetical protein